MAKPINVVIKGEYTDRDINRAIRDLERLKSQSAVTGGALGTFQKGMVAAGGALAAAFSFDAVINAMKDAAQAAMQDEKSMVALATAMDNVGLASQNAQAEGLIESMMLQTGIADDALRPAYQKLVTVTKDVTEAQSLLQTALDLSAAGYGDLESASKALSAAANGNFTALQRLKVPIDQAALASKDFDAAVASLNRTVGGQAAAAAETYAGQMARLNVAVGEAQEAIGYALLNSINSVITRMGGVGGLQDTIIKTGDDIAILIDGVTSLYDAFNDLTSPLQSVLNISGGFGGRQGKSLVDWLKDVLSNLGPVGRTVATLITSLQVLGLQSDYAASAADGLTSGTVQAAKAAGAAKGPVNGLTGSMNALADGADAAAESMAKTVMAANALALEHEHLGLKERVTGKTTLERYKATLELRDILNATTSSSRGAASATDQLTEAQQRAADRAQKLKDDTASLESAMRGLLQEISPAVASAANATFESVNAQIDAFKAAFQEARTYAQGIVSTFMGQLDLGAALDQAKATGTTIIEAFTKQGEKVQEFGKKMNELLNAGLSRAAFDDIMRLGYQRGMEVATALTDGNVAGNVASVNKVYGSVKTMAEQVAEAAKTAFYQAGLDLILSTVRAMVESLGVGGKGRKQLMSLMDELSAAMSRNATITVGVVTTGGGGGGGGGGMALPSGIGDYTGGIPPGFDFPLLPPDLPLSLDFSGGTPPPGFMFADGGIATRATPGIFGEAGPEALIPLDRMDDFGGNTYSITVQAGVGDPRAIGRTVVEAITSFERSSGPVFARA